MRITKKLVYGLETATDQVSCSNVFESHSVFVLFISLCPSSLSYILSFFGVDLAFFVADLPFLSGFAVFE